MNIWLRDAVELTDDSDILIHMGTGDPARFDPILDRCITGYQDYRGILPNRLTRGIFAVSTFGAVAGVSQSDITRALKQNKFARATYGELKDDFEIYPTSMDAGVEPTVMAVHFDIALPDDDCTLIDAHASDALPESVEQFLTELLRPRLKDLLQRLRPYPRLDKRDIWPEQRG